uniref:Uncharacterized protein n=1 Tax=Trypanosoma vivax (strain Y486) TaxID=1055687 RepID=G0UCM2_TRYVY|nr:hypothetical protein TVY486_1110660 [Trypanosoma vivax Y486]
MFRRQVAVLCLSACQEVSPFPSNKASVPECSPLLAASFFQPRTAYCLQLCFSLSPLGPVMRLMPSAHPHLHSLPCALAIYRLMEVALCVRKLSPHGFGKDLPFRLSFKTAKGMRLHVLLYV